MVRQPGGCWYYLRFYSASSAAVPTPKWGGKAVSGYSSNVSFRRAPVQHRAGRVFRLTICARAHGASVLLEERMWAKINSEHRKKK